MMIHDFKPYSFVEDKAFVKLMHQLEPPYKIPHRTAFQDLLSLHFTKR